MPASPSAAAARRPPKSKAQTATNLQLDEFYAIEEQIASSARGRSFLRMRDRRASLLGKDDWETSLQDLRGWILQSRAEVEEEAQLGVLRRELMEMAASIRRAKSEIAALRPPEAAPVDGKEAAANRHINLATEELGAIVHATERATSDILNGAERLMEIAGDLRAPDLGAAVTADRANQIDMIGMEIMTACGFQDITGQRISKVVNALRYIEERIDGMIRIWGPVMDGDAGDIPPPSTDKRPDGHLLNGPALKGGMDQSSIDSLLADMSGPAKPAAASGPSRPAPAPAPAPEEDPWAAAGLPAAAAPAEPEIDEADWGLPPAAPPAPKLVASNPNPPPARPAPAAVKKAETPAAAALDQSAIDSLFA